MEKVFKTNRQLIKKMRERGIEINKSGEGSRVISILKKENYYNVVNGYKDLFIKIRQTATADDVYKNGTKFNEIYSLYCFDRNIRMIYLKQLLKIESMLKTAVAYEFSKKHGYKNFLKIENFDTTPTNNTGILRKIARENHLNLNNQNDLSKAKRINKENKIVSITSLFSSIEKGVSKQLGKRSSYVSHYMTNHGYIPLWVLVNIMSFGTFTYFYNNMITNDKIAVSKKYNLWHKDLYKYMCNLSLARNFCAHGERFFDIRFKKALKTSSINNFSLLNIPNNNGNYSYGINDSYSIAVIFALLLKKAEVKNFISQIKTEFEMLNKNLITISINDVKDKMGFGPSWEKLILLSR